MAMAKDKGLRLKPNEALREERGKDPMPSD